MVELSDSRGLLYPHSDHLASVELSGGWADAIMGASGERSDDYGRTHERGMADRTARVGARGDFGRLACPLGAWLPPPPEKRATQQMLLEMVQRVVAEELTDRQRQALVAVMGSGMPLEEVARRMGINRNALYELLHDARRRLKKRLLARGLLSQNVTAVCEA